MKYTIQEERLNPETYIGFLKTTDLGSQYPKERFEDRIARLLKNASLCLTARDETGKLAGVCMGITDFAYWLFITDLGVSRDCTGQGLGRRLVQALHAAAGGEKDIAMYTVPNDEAVPFYEKLGMVKSEEVMEYNHIEWTGFTVS